MSPREASITAAGLRGFLCGAALLIGVSSLLSAWSGDAALWTSSPVGGARAWNLACGVGWLLLTLDGLRPFPRRPRTLLIALFATVCAAALLDVADYYRLIGAGTIGTRRALPASAAVAGLAVAAISQLRSASWAERGAGHAPACDCRRRSRRAHRPR